MVNNVSGGSTLQVAEKLAVQNPRRSCRGTVIRSLTVALLLAVLSADGWGQAPDWQGQVRKYAEARDWASAMRLVEQEIARAPQDMDVRAWRARVLAWSGKLPQAEKEYLEVLKVARADPDNWMGLAGVYLREGKVVEANRAISTAEELDPKRSDIHAAHARILREEGQRKEGFKVLLKAVIILKKKKVLHCGCCNKEAHSRCTYEKTI